MAKKKTKRPSKAVKKFVATGKYTPPKPLPKGKTLTSFSVVATAAAKKTKRASSYDNMRLKIETLETTNGDLVVNQRALLQSAHEQAIVANNLSHERNIFQRAFQLLEQGTKTDVHYINSLENLIIKIVHADYNKVSTDLGNVGFIVSDAKNTANNIAVGRQTSDASYGQANVAKAYDGYARGEQCESSPTQSGSGAATRG